MDALRFALLGLGAGSVYVLVGHAVVLTYRTSGVLNFAQAALGMVSAYSFYLWHEQGVPTAVALPAALVVGSVLSVAIEWTVVRHLRQGTALAKMISSLAVLTLVLSSAQLAWGTDPRIPSRLLPSGSVVFLDDLVIGTDRLVILSLTLAITVVLALVYSRTRLGLATTAVAEDPLVAARFGVDPSRTATVNWAIGGALSGAGAILIVAIAGLDASNLSLLVVPALAAALFGGFRSFWLTLVGGLAIGILQSEVSYLQVRFGTDVDLSGWGSAVPLVVIIGILLFRGEAIPVRGDDGQALPAADGPTSPLAVAAVGAAVLLFATLGPWSASVVDGLITWSAISIVAVSIVLVTGYAGQVSLAQFAIAGIGAWSAARLVADHGLDHGLAAVLGVLVAVPIGVVVGLPALRTRGVSLAVATLGLALVIESMVLTNPNRTGGINGTVLGTVHIFGVDIDARAHPERYLAFALGLLVLVATGVAMIRRSALGASFLAVRANERAAEAVGIDVPRTKLLAFAIASAIAAAGGVVVAYRNPTVTFFPTFSVIQSVFVVLFVAIGGIGHLGGAVIAGLFAPGVLSQILPGGGVDELVMQAGAAVLMLALLRWRPDGLASLVPQLAPGRPPRTSSTHGAPADTSERPRPRGGGELRLRGLTVRFGGAAAVDDLSFSVGSGEVVGLIGANGAGKTSCLDAICGFAPHAAGRIELDGVAIDGWRPSRRARAGLGRSFQGLELFEDLTVLENLSLGSAGTKPRWRGSRRTLAVTSMAREVAADVGIDHLLHRRPDSLSNGERRLVAIARALAARPKVLLLDEPAAGLSEAETRELGATIRRHVEGSGVSVLIVEHDMALVMRLCDRVIVMAAGRSIADGRPHEVRSDRAVREAYLGEGVAAAPTDPTSAPNVGETLLEVSGLRGGYGLLEVVHGVDIEVRRGEVTALLGANGAGKSTTLLALVGVIVPTGGQVSMLGSDQRRELHHQARLGLGFVPEGRSIVRSLTVAENLRLGRCDEVVALEVCPPLRALLQRPARLLSGGEQQMLALAVAIARAPDLLVIDELSFGLSPMLAERLLQAVRGAADRGAGVLLVEQDTARALRWSDRAVVLRRGEVVLTGGAEALATRPDDLEAAYLGLHDQEEPMVPVQAPAEERHG